MAYTGPWGLGGGLGRGQATWGFKGVGLVLKFWDTVGFSVDGYRH